MTDGVDERGPDRDSWLVRTSDVAAVRRHVHGSASVAGLRPDEADQFTVAVNEIVINAIRHGGGSAEVSVVGHPPTDGQGGEITVTVRDRGPGLVVDGPPRLPPADQTHGRGLWLVARMCGDVMIDSSSQGTVVRLRATG